jgi:uncharacterized Zn finger protein
VSNEPCTACGGNTALAKRRDEEGRPVLVCLACGHINSKPLTAAPAGSPILGQWGCYRREPVIYD